MAMDDKEGEDLELEDRLAIIGLTKEQFASLQENKVDLTPFLRDEQGHYAWDRWEERAVAGGVKKELAQLGRAVMREAVQHDWPQKLKRECGWADDGKKMLRFVLDNAEQAKSRWDFLMETDGNQGRWDDKTGRWMAF